MQSLNCSHLHVALTKRTETGKAPWNLPKSNAVTEIGEHEKEKRFLLDFKGQNKHIKVKFTLELATKAQKGSTLSLTSALDGGGWSTPLFGCSTPGKDPVPIE
jgi:hypothetical protein